MSLTPDSLAAPLLAGERYNIHTIPLHLVDRIVAAHRPPVFIETGTYLGRTVEQVQHLFQEVYTIELSVDFARNAMEKFAAHGHVTVVFGDAGEMLNSVLQQIEDQQALIWLDAHWSGGATAQTSTATHTSIRRELAALAKAPRRDHVLMIDDLVDFDGRNGYPTREELRELVRAIGPYTLVELDLRRGVLLARPDEAR